VFHFVPQALGRNESPAQVAVVKPHDELFSTPAAIDVGLARHASQQFAHRRQNRVTRSVPALIIDSLEVIDIEQNARQGCTVPARAANFHLEVLPQSAAIHQAS
jgi:hypothetical protein